MSKYYDKKELDLIGHDVSFTIEDTEEKLRKLGVPQPELVAMGLTISTALWVLDCDYFTAGARLSELRAIKQRIDNFYDHLSKEAEREQEEMKHTNVVYVNFNKGRKI